MNTKILHKIVGFFLLSLNVFNKKSTLYSSICYNKQKRCNEKLIHMSAIYAYIEHK